MAASGYDQLRSTSTINLTGATLSAVVTSNLGETVFAAPMTIVTAGAGNLSGTFTGLNQGDTVTSLAGFGGHGDWSINYDFAAGVVQIVPVPEPGLLLAAGAGAMAFFARRRGRRVE